jgi:hypothetical protein
VSVLPAPENGKSWRDVLLEYNELPGNNPLGLYPAYWLYKNPTYRRLVEAFGMANLLNFSSGSLQTRVFVSFTVSFSFVMMFRMMASASSARPRQQITKSSA